MGRNRRFMIIIIVGVITWFIASQIGKDKTKPKAKPEQPQQQAQAEETKEIESKPRISQVVCARVDIEKGDLIHPNSIVVKDVVRKEKEKDTFSSLDDLKGLVAIKNIAADEQIRKEQVKDLSGVMKLSYHVPKGARAISVKISNPQFVISGLVSQGDPVDVIAVYDNSKDVDVPYSRTVIQKAVLLALGTSFNPEGDKTSTQKNPTSKKSATKKTSKTSGKSSQAAATGVEGKKIDFVTLAVSPEEAEAIPLIAKRAEFYLTLRFPYDDAVMEKSGTSQQAVLGFTRRSDLIKSIEEQTRINEMNERSIAIFRGVEKEISKAGSVAGSGSSSD